MILQSRKLWTRLRMRWELTFICSCWNLTEKDLVRGHQWAVTYKMCHHTCRKDWSALAILRQNSHTWLTYHCCDITSNNKQDGSQYKGLKVFGFRSLCCRFPLSQLTHTQDVARFDPSSTFNQPCRWTRPKWVNLNWSQCCHCTTWKFYRSFK